MSLKYIDSNGNELNIAGVGKDSNISDVQVNGNSVLNDGIANITTNTQYNSTSNKIATMSDVIDGVVDFTSSVTFNETPQDKSFKYKNGVVYIHYNGQAKAHANNAVIFTIPSGYRPPLAVFTPFTKSGSCYGRFWIGTDGRGIISGISSTSSTDRLAFSVSYVV